MRADRLLSLLMLLQTRGRMTARELAEALEVSERTIYRDVEALSCAGVPIYGECGRLGGYALVDSYRTSLTGLTEGEVRALFMLNIPQPLIELGVSDELRAALLKLSAALPGARRDDQVRVQQRFYLDSTWWHQGGEALPHLPVVQRAVWEDRQLYLTYHLPSRVAVEHVFDPYGLVAKAGVWYLVCARAGRVDARRVLDLLGVRLAEGGFERPDDFDLAAFWHRWRADHEARRALYPVIVRVAPSLIPALRHFFLPIDQTDPPDPDGWLTLTLSFESLEAARAQLLGFGRSVQVLAPRPLRRSLLDYAEQIVALYTG